MGVMPMDWMNWVLEKIQSIWDYLIHKGGIVFSFVLTAIITLIGFPKQVINFIIFLFVMDILTRWYTIVVVNYKYFTFKNFIQAWKDKKLNSKSLKRGIFVKLFIYFIILVMAHQAGITNEFIFGQVVSNFLYSILIILDCISIFENLLESGFAGANPILQFFKNKKNEIVKK